MTEERAATFIVWFLFAGLIISLLYIVGYLAYADVSNRCLARWQGTFRSEYGHWSGCRVEIDGKMIPENSIREFLK